MSTVSEGIAYGMLIAVYMGTKDDQMLFDDLWKYSQAHLNGNGLMNWAIASDGTGVTGTGGATDADEDIAFALLMADKQWGSAGSLNYLNLAKAQINNIWLHEIVDSKLAGPGDSWGPTDLWKNINISYFAPAYLPSVQDGRLRPRLGRRDQDRLRHDHQPDNRWTRAR